MCMPIVTFPSHGVCFGDCAYLLGMCLQQVHPVCVQPFCSCVLLLNEASGFQTRHVLICNANCITGRFLCCAHLHAFGFL